MPVYFHNQSSTNVEAVARLLSEKNLPPVSFTVIQYDEVNFFEEQFTSLEKLNAYLSKTSCTSEYYCTWINIDGIHDMSILDALAIRFNLHNLVKEDISAFNERMKLDMLEGDSCIYLLLKMLSMERDAETETNLIRQEQISILLKQNNLLITFQEAKTNVHVVDLFQGLKHRLRNNRGRIRSLKADYLFYCLLDVIIEHYMLVLDHFNVKIDFIERLLMRQLRANQLSEPLGTSMSVEELELLFHMKHNMFSFRILCKPLREIIMKLQKAQDRVSVANRQVHSRRQYRRKRRPKHIALSGNYFVNPSAEGLTRRWSLGSSERDRPLFNEYIFIYFKDLNDHIIQLHDRIDTYCDLLSSLITLYIILTDADMNKIMRTLTLVSAAFIPLMFIIGLFSMNYENAPPLAWDNGYFVVLGVLGTCVILLFSFFKYKTWL